MKRLVYLMAVTAAVASLAACGVTVEKTVTHEQSTSNPEEMYMGNNGWDVIYDTRFFNMNELEKGTSIELIYTDECMGSTYIELTEVADVSAKELIEAKKAEYEKTSEIYDVKGENKSGYVFYVPGIVVEETDGNDRYTSVEALTINDGTLLVISSQMLDDEMKVSDRIADVINGIEIIK